MDLRNLTDQELVSHCISASTLTPLEVELLHRLEGHLDSVGAAELDDDYRIRQLERELEEAYGRIGDLEYALRMAEDEH